jgi:CRP-like cAMP-binding protein
MGFIKEEFMKPPGDMARDIKMLDRVLKDLKFFKRFDNANRQLIYKNAEFVHIQGHQVIFNQGDVGDKLYVILKGRVAVQI